MWKIVTQIPVEVVRRRTHNPREEQDLVDKLIRGKVKKNCPIKITESPEWWFVFKWEKEEGNG